MREITDNIINNLFSNRNGMKIFITGGTGFLGQRVIKRIAKDHSEILGLTRSSNSSKKLESLNVNPVHGSLEDIPRWENKLSGVDIVIHCAAPVEFWGDWGKYQKGIVEPTEALFKAAEQKGVKKFIFISSESVLQDKKDLIDIDESESYPDSPNSYYGKSKMIAEQFILAQESDMESIIIRPTFIWGKGVQALDTMIEKVKSEDFLWIDHGKSLFEMVHVDNVAESVALACIKGVNKNIYFVTDDNTQPVKDFLTKLIKTQGVIPPEKSIPKGIAGILASIVEKIWRVFDIQRAPPITKFDLSFVAMGRKYNIEKIKKDLGYKPVVSEGDGLEEMKKEIIE
jgi:nucleoside-diphosphate-sugar epimerase